MDPIQENEDRMQELLYSPLENEILSERVYKLLSHQ